ncbi:MAG: hypothetical protein ABIH39_03825 [Candidatus Margulisiibacteriota bacterium]
MNRTINNIVYLLSITSAAFLVFIMAALIIFRQEFFIDKNTLSFVEIAAVTGVVLILLFNITSFLWLVRNVFSISKNYLPLLLLSGICIVLLFGEKVMIDEIGRESILGWETSGECIILYSFFTVQLFYNIYIMRISKKSA